VELTFGLFSIDRYYYLYSAGKFNIGRIWPHAQGIKPQGIINMWRQFSAGAIAAK
jgi:hypothetical protein